MVEGEMRKINDKVCVEESDLGPNKETCWSLGLGFCCLELRMSSMGKPSDKRTSNSCDGYDVTV
jgi:hypothetical protein